ncbi:hypothetical protein K438DRAFT_998610 [Mycena galopus ATCC 62051]|nr:hypothetical protein K438DRAFT_998610 [Mycena galopus ATCC 62051]
MSRCICMFATLLGGALTKHSKPGNGGILNWETVGTSYGKCLELFGCVLAIRIFFLGISRSLLFLVRPNGSVVLTCQPKHLGNSTPVILELCSQTIHVASLLLGICCMPLLQGSLRLQAGAQSYHGAPPSSTPFEEDRNPAHLLLH